MGIPVISVWEEIVITVVCNSLSLWKGLSLSLRSLQVPQTTSQHCSGFYPFFSTALNKVLWTVVAWVTGVQLTFSFSCCLEAQGSESMLCSAPHRD